MTPLEFHEVCKVEKALEIARRAAKLYRFDWSSYLRTLHSELRRQFEDTTPERFA